MVLRAALLFLLAATFFSFSHGFCQSNYDCPSGPCINGRCCTPQAVNCAGRCGVVADGCSGTLCSCPAGQVCHNGACCTPKTACPTTFGRCGEFSDSCGGTFTCFSCAPGQLCSIAAAGQSTCCTANDKCPPDFTGAISNGCGGQVGC